MTFRKWSLLYKAYKQDFDIELMLKLQGKRYADLKPITIDDVIPI